MTFKFKLISFTLLLFTIGTTLPPSNSSDSNEYNALFVTPPSAGYDFNIISYKVPFTVKDFVGFKEFLGFFESGSDYKKINRLGYLGKYQFGKSTLKVLKIDYLKNDFINEPALQEKLLELRKDLLALQQRIGGSKARSEVGEKNEFPTIRDYIWPASSYGTTYGPTKLQLKCLDNANQLYKELTIELNKIQDAIEPLKSELQKIGSPKIRD